jgi:hypothetical protein
MMPHGWHETRGERATTFTFRSTSLARAIVMSAVFAPIPIVASMMTVAAARAGNWGWGAVRRVHAREHVQPHAHRRG